MYWEPRIVYGDVEIDLEKPFERISMVDAVKKYKGIDFSNITSVEEARKLADEHKVEYEPHHEVGTY